MTRTDEVITRMSRNWFGNPPQWFVDAVNELRRLEAENADLRAALSAHSAIPEWITYDPQTDVVTIHGKKYAAALFGTEGFISPAGTLLRIAQGPDDVVTCKKVQCAHVICNWI